MNKIDAWGPFTHAPREMVSDGSHVYITFGPYLKKLNPTNGTELMTIAGFPPNTNVISGSPINANLMGIDFLPGTGLLCGDMPNRRIFVVDPGTGMFTEWAVPDIHPRHIEVDPTDNSIWVSDGSNRLHQYLLVGDATPVTVIDMTYTSISALEVASDGGVWVADLASKAIYRNGVAIRTGLECSEILQDGSTFWLNRGDAHIIEKCDASLAVLDSGSVFAPAGAAVPMAGRIAVSDTISFTVPVFDIAAVPAPPVPTEPTTPDDGTVEINIKVHGKGKNKP